jgi:hypothetical protein
LAPNRLDRISAGIARLICDAMLNRLVPGGLNGGPVANLRQRAAVFAPRFDLVSALQYRAARIL